MSEMPNAAGFVIWRKSAGATLFLMLRAANAKRHWTPPKGYIDPDDVDAVQAAFREVMEETAIPSNCLKVLEWQWEAAYVAWKRRKVVRYYLAESLQSDVRISREHTAFEWRTLAQIQECPNTYDNTKQMISSAEEFVRNETFQQNCKMRLGLDAFALRQFQPGYAGSCIEGVSPEEFLEKVNVLAENAELVEGYAHFCKHVFIANFTPAQAGAVLITDEIRPKIQSGYEARSESELPVLCRWVSRADVKEAPPAKFLDLILYSREQIAKEKAATKAADSVSLLPEADWSVISVKVQNEPFETPMTPITMLRNTLIEEGGSGTPLDRARYLKSVEFWKSHVLVR
ncbi:MAG: uncharacterized protein KVP18_003633 [Porospora cf. gigantea A]|uniref:uncharacterized protein n=1 Tax=Porospora cf. gigantea A TaxID=2853593 RepID=UPI00355A0F0F|nr:MAG: hypothetical protein KVP18_003633 [Porospora cf. gigantea A]